MDPIKDYEFLQSYAEDNVYDIVRRIGKHAHTISEHYHNIPLYSECIEWIVSGRCPSIMDRYNAILQLKDSKAQLISQVLQYVDSKKLKLAVVKSVSQSIKQNYLSYNYDHISDLYTQIRIRILTNMIWYQLYRRKE